MDSQQQPSEGHQLGPGATVQFSNRLLRIGDYAGNVAGKGNLQVGDGLGNEGVVLAGTPITRRRIDGWIRLPGLMDVPSRTATLLRFDP
jgi:hypothetical protein